MYNDEQQYRERFSQAIEYWVRDGYQETELTTLVLQQLKGTSPRERYKEISSNVLTEYHLEQKAAYHLLMQAKAVSPTVHKQTSIYARRMEGLAAMISTLNDVEAPRQNTIDTRTVRGGRPSPR